MDISTKFNIYEKVFVMHNNRIVETNINSNSPETFMLLYL